MTNQNLQKELDELMEATQFNGNTRAALRREFAAMTQNKKREFVDEFCWRVIKTVKPKNYVN